MNNEGDKVQKKLIVKQQDQKDCGVCCLLSILKYFKGYVPLEQIRLDTKTSNLGTSAFHMVETLKKYGFDAYGCKIKKEEFWNTEFPLPAIVHVVLDSGQNHYMVLYEKRKEKVVLMDPSFGKRVMTESDFFWIWSEVLLIAYPKEEIIKREQTDHKMQVFLTYLGKKKSLFLKLIGSEMILLVISIGSSFYLKVANAFLERKNEILFITVFFAWLLILKIIMMKEILKKNHSLNKHLELLHVTNYLDHVKNLPLSLFKTRTIGDYLNRFWENTEIKYLYSEIMKNKILSVITIFLCFVLLYGYQSFFFHFYLFVFLVFSIFMLCIHQENYQKERERLEAKCQYQDRLLERLKQNEVIHHLGIEKYTQPKEEADLICFLKQNEEIEKFNENINWLENALKEGTEFLFLVLGVYQMSKGKLEIFNFIMIETIGFYLLNSLENFVQTLSKEKYLNEIIHKNQEFLSLPIEEERKTDSFEQGDIFFKNVSFSYDNYRYVLKDLTLCITKGTHVLLMGESGSGKSTICKLLLKDEKTINGTIEIGDHNILDIQKQALHEKIVYLNQKSNLMTGTIKENIVMYRPFHTSRFDQVCKICKIEEIVQKRPLRYETTINSQENNFSGGEKARIMLARTLYKDAEVYLLDEALSEIDEQMEKEIIKDMRVFLKEKTVLYISHRKLKSLFDETKKCEECHERILISE